LALDTRAASVTDSGTTFVQYLSLFTELRTALEQEQPGSIRNILAELECKPLDDTTKKAINDIANAVLMSDFEEALKEIDTLVGVENGREN
jgi:hypothetical protein